MELRQLKYFVSVAETLSFSEAAKLMCVTQSTLSQQVKQLEGELGTMLFIRNSHGVSLTETGREMLPYARLTLQDADQCLTRIADITDMRTRDTEYRSHVFFQPYPHRDHNHISQAISGHQAEHPLQAHGRAYGHAPHAQGGFRACLPADLPAARYRVPYPVPELSGRHRAGKSSVGRQEEPYTDRAGDMRPCAPFPRAAGRAAFDGISIPGLDFRIKIEMNEVNILLKIIRQTSLVSVLAEATIHNERGVVAVPLDFPGNEMAGCVHTLRGTYRKRAMQEFIRLLSDSLAVRERQNAWL